MVGHNEQGRNNYITDRADEGVIEVIGMTN